MGSGAYFTTMWQQTTGLFLPLNKEFSQDEYSPNCSPWFFGEWNYRRPSFSMLFLHCLNNSMFFMWNIAFIEKSTENIYKEVLAY